VVNGSSIRDGRSWRIGVSIDDFVATLFALSDDRGDAAEDAFAFGVCALFGVAVEDFCGGGEAGF
jgi:hypothetical protein